MKVEVIKMNVNILNQDINFEYETSEKDWYPILCKLEKILPNKSKYEK